MIDTALPRLRGIDRERLQREGHVRLNFEEQLSDSGSQFSDFLPFAHGNFGTFCNVPVVKEMEEAGLLEMSAADARTRSIVDGDVVCVFNRRGDILLRVRVDGAVQAGVASARLHWAKLSTENWNINVPYFGKTYGPRQLRYVLFRLG